MMSSSLSSVEGGLPAGFRFHPKDEELICEYLVKWVGGCAHPFPSLIQVDLNKCEPWDIPETACVGGKEWYFYSQRDRKYATGLRTNRATLSGYWKATGKDRPVHRKRTLVGMRKTLVFYEGRAPKGQKTEWVMHEFRQHGPGQIKTSHLVKEDWVLCRVFYKSRKDIRIPSRHGASSAAVGQEATPPSSPSQVPGLIAQPYMIPHEVTPEQVSCFSTFNQTNPNFSHHLDPPQILLQCPDSRIISSPLPADYLGINNYYTMNSMMSTAASNSSCDNNYNRAMVKGSEMVSGSSTECERKGSPISFGEAAGSSDSYLSEVGLSSSLWINHYQS